MREEKCEKSQSPDFLLILDVYANEIVRSVGKMMAIITIFIEKKEEAVEKILPLDQ